MPHSEIVVVSLFAIAFLVAAFNSAIGPTGGALISSITFFFPPPASIVLHALTGVFSSAARAVSMRANIDVPFFRAFLIGTLAGVPLAALLAFNLNPNVWTAIIGVYLLASTLVPQIEAYIASIKRLWLISGLSGFVSFYVGTGGKIINPIILARSKDRLEVIATQSACVAVQHFVKLAILFAVVTSYWKLWPYALVLFAGSLAGNFVGGRILLRLEDAQHRFLQRAVLAILGISLIFVAIYRTLNP